ncbi:MAG: hypothetical protein LUE90_02035 [Clostridiales bacterium]|nr:hypothetical protein [Clostridiales bacterium]
MSLLKGNELNPSKAQRLDLVLRRPAGESVFNELIVGNNEILFEHLDDIKNLLSNDLITAAETFIKEN